MKRYSKSKVLHFFFDFWFDFWYPRKAICLLFAVVIIVGTTCFLFKAIIIFCNVLLSCAFSQNISARYSVSALKYFSEQILVALARNPLNMLVIASEGIQECGLLRKFARAASRWTSNSYLPFFFFHVQKV